MPAYKIKSDEDYNQQIETLQKELQFIKDELTEKKKFLKDNLRHYKLIPDEKIRQEMENVLEKVKGQVYDYSVGLTKTKKKIQNVKYILKMRNLKNTHNDDTMEYTEDLTTTEEDSD